MDIEKEAALRGRILAAANVLSDAYKIAIPDALRSASGNRFEREISRLDAMATFLEALVLETAQSGLSKKLGEYSEISVLRRTEDEDLLQIDGIGKSTVKAIRKSLGQDYGESNDQGES